MIQSKNYEKIMMNKSEEISEKLLNSVDLSHHLTKISAVLIILPPIIWLLGTMNPIHSKKRTDKTASALNFLSMTPVFFVKKNINVFRQGLI